MAKSFFDNMYSSYGAPVLLGHHGNPEKIRYQVETADGTVIQDDEFTGIIGHITAEEEPRDGLGLVKIERRQVEVPTDTAQEFGGVDDAQLIGFLLIDGEKWRVDPLEGRGIELQSNNFVTLNVKRSFVLQAAADGILKQAT